MTCFIQRLSHNGDGVIPMALIAGELRGIPFFWRLIDCLFGIIGGLVLWRRQVDINSLKRLEA